MQKIRSYLMQVQNAFAFIDGLTKAMYRSCAIIACGVTVFTVVSLTSNSFNGAGKNKTTAAITKSESCDTGDEAEIDDAVLEAFNVAMPEDTVDTSEQQLSVVEDVFLAANDSALVQVELSEVTEDEPVANITAVPNQTVATAVYNSAVGNYTEDDLIALRRIVQAEAGGCDMVGKILVANVIINRMHSNRFPNTISEVIFSPNQFSPVKSGSYYRVTVSDSTIEAVDRALSGEDYSQGALFFASTACVANGKCWAARHYKKYFEHDGHVFFGP